MAIVAEGCVEVVVLLIKVSMGGGGNVRRED